MTRNQKSCKCTIFLRFLMGYAIIIHNAVKCWNGTWRQGYTTNALLSGRAFVISVWNDFFMAVSYRKLWTLLIDKDMRKKVLCAKAGISPVSVTIMGRNSHVTTEVLLNICTGLDCDVEDIMEIVSE